MKKNTQLTKYLDEYLRMDTPQFAVMITGKWGCGKTYYIKKRIEAWNAEKVRSEKEVIVLKPIYVSVYGLSSISSLVKRIKVALNPILYSKGAKVAKKVVMTALHVVTKSAVDIDGDGSGEDLSSLLDAEGLLEVFKSDSSSIKGNRVLIIDDLERCKINLDELFGFVNDIVEHSNSKVILICDENRLRETAKHEHLCVGYESFKEKLVGQTFSFAVDYPFIVGGFVDASQKEQLSENKAMVIDLFVASKYDNLRLIRHCLIDIVRFFEQLPGGIATNPNYKRFVSNVIAYLVIVSLEERFGNVNIQYFQPYSFGEATRAAVQELENKYNTVLEQYGINHSLHTIPIHNLISFVRTGFIDDPAYLLSNCRMLQSRNMANWEKLWYYFDLSSEEFAKILKQEKKRFYNKQLDYVFEVAHLAGILLALERKKLVKLSRAYVVGVAKSNVNAIYERYPDDEAHLILKSQGYEFLEGDSDEMRAITSYIQGLFQNNNEVKEKEYVAGVWNSLGTEITCKDLDKLFDEVTPARRCSYSGKAIFKQVAPRVLVKKIVSLSNRSKREFSLFLVHRYYLKGSSIIASIPDEMKADKPSLTKISEMLRSSAKRLQLIDKEMTLLVANKIDEAVARM